MIEAIAINWGFWLFGFVVGAFWAGRERGDD